MVDPGKKPSMGPGRPGGRLATILLVLQSFLAQGALGAEFQGDEGAASGRERSVPQASAPGVDALRRGLKSLRLPEGSASLWVLDLDRDLVLTSEAAERPRPPASLVKLLPMGAALLSLGPAFR